MSVGCPSCIREASTEDRATGASTPGRPPILDPWPFLDLLVEERGGAEELVDQPPA